MMRHTPLPVVDGVWRALRDGVGLGRPNAMAVFVDRFRDVDLVPEHALSDLVDDFGLRDLAHAEGLLAAFDVEVVSGFKRPRARDRIACGGSYVALADTAALLVRLERHGLNVDPVPLVAAVRPRLLARPILTRAELDVWWHGRERHRGESVALVADADGVAGGREIRTAAGYRAEAWIAADGRASQVWVRAPKYRRRARAA